MQIKFMWNGVKIDGKLYRGAYYTGEYTATSGIPAGTITMHRLDYAPTPHIPGLIIHNESNIMDDYCKSDSIRIAPGSKWYAAAKAAADKAEAHFERMQARRYGRM